jgi:hypothetical protein
MGLGAQLCFLVTDDVSTGVLETRPTRVGVAGAVSA